METPLHHNRDWLYKQYAINKLSADDISKLANVCGPIILKWLRKLNIPVRKISDPYFKPPLNRAHRPFKNYDWLYEHYIIKSLSTPRIAKIVAKQTNSKVDGHTIAKWMERFGIKRNNKYFGDKSPGWKGGRGFHKQSNTWWLTVNGERIIEYRHIASQILNRKLNKGEVIHHINGNRSDNNPKNLYLFSSESKHQKYHQTLYHYILSKMEDGIINLSNTNFFLVSNLTNLSKNG